MDVEYEGKHSAGAIEWLQNYHGSIDSTALLMAYEAGGRANQERHRAVVEAAKATCLQFDTEDEREDAGIALRAALDNLKEKE